MSLPDHFPVDFAEFQSFQSFMAWVQEPGLKHSGSGCFSSIIGLRASDLKGSFLRVVGLTTLDVPSYI